MDIANTEIMKNRFAAMIEEAAVLAYRTAQTTFMKQTQDYSVGLSHANGETFANPVLNAGTLGGGKSIIGIIKHYPDFAPGDVVITNDPFRTDGVITHQMDIHVAQPLFFQGELIAFAWAFVHATDIGGAVPTSISPELHECFQEGFRIRPTKLKRAGVLNQDVANFVKDNSRMGEEVWGDLEAMMAAMRLLEQRMNALCERVGPGAVRQGIDDVLDYAEAKARSVISGLLDGEYEFSDYLEASATGQAIHIRCRLRIKGDEAEIDYAGSDPQVKAAFNFSAGERTHQFLCLGLANYIHSVEPSAPVNHGIMRPMRAVAPSGTIMNAEFPAAMGNRWVTAMRCYDALIGCVNQAIPAGAVTACGAGQAGIISVAWQDARSARTRVASVEPFSGGSGARVRADGVDASDTLLGFLKNTPVEHVEAEAPILVRQHALVPSSFGHGKYRGGAAVRIELECLSEEAAIVVRGMDRLTFQPWGVQGGYPGRGGKSSLIQSGEETSLGAIGVVPVQRGDVLRIVSPAGGGFGMPSTRVPALVLDDVLNGMLDETEAREIYGVVISDGVLDTAATEQRRADIAIEEAGAQQVTHGQGRLDYEAKWPVESSVAFANAILGSPPGLRAPLEREARDALRATQLPISAVLVNDTVTSLIRRMRGSDISAEAS